jgi:uncharacterized protein YegP (UPF0339 family)
MPGALDRIEVYPREDGRWAWRRVAPNNEVIATDGSQGYESKSFAIGAAQRACETPTAGVDWFDHDPRIPQAEEAES